MSGRKLADGALGFGLDGEFKARGETDSAQHAELVLFEAPVRLADGADDAVAEIVAAADVVENGGGQAAGLALEDGVEHHAVDGEVAAEDIFLRRRGEADFGGVAAVEVGDVGAKCSNLGDNFAGVAGCGGIVEVLADQNDAELGADGEGLREHGEDDVRMRAGGNVEIFRLDAEEHVAHAAAGEVRLVAGGTEPDDDVLGGELGGVIASAGQACLAR